MSFARARAHRGGPVAARAPAPPVQAKLRIGAANDTLEHEADRAADAVMRGEAVGALKSAPRVARRACSACKAEADEQAPIQRKCAACESAGAGHEAAGEAAGSAIATGGTPLAPQLRRYFEPRFGRDFSNVRVHTHGRAAAAADSIGARAYALGSDLAFAHGQFDSARPEGRRLIAHELAHIVQQSGAAPGTVRRTVASYSRCPANVEGASATPIADLTAADAAAQLMSLGAANLLAAEALTFADPTFGPSYVFDAYQHRFGLPNAAGRGRFFNRLTGAVLATQEEAMRAEMQILSTRFEHTNTFLSQSIFYRCPGATTPASPRDCAHTGCDPGEYAFTCPAGGGGIAVCNPFWSAPEMNDANPRAGTIIHEAIHRWLGAHKHRHEGAHRLATPECYAAFVADIYGFAHNDQDDCATIP
jgi:hypothetical protein